MDESLKQCTGECKEFKPETLENFRRSQGGRLGLRSVCRKCENKYNRAKAKLNKDKWMPAKRNGELLRKYGIGLDTYNKMLESQNFQCKLCNSDTANRPNSVNFCVDHCHKTGHVRGLLCHSCNTMIGMIEKTNQDAILERIKAYLC